MALEQIDLQNVLFSYVDEVQKTELAVKVADAAASLHIDTAQVYTIASRGQITVQRISTEAGNLLTDKAIGYRTTLFYHTETSELRFEPSHVQVEQAAFRVQGAVSQKSGDTWLDVYAAAEEANIQTLLVAAPCRAKPKV